MIKKRKTQKRGESGFSLLETAVASMVMLVGLMGVMQLFVISALYNNSSRQTTVASMVAKRVIEQLISAPFPTTEVAPLGYTDNPTNLTIEQLLQANKTVAGYNQNFYVRYRDVNGGNGAMEVATTPFTTNQPVDYVASWVVRPDNVTQVVSGVTVPVYPNMRIITVRVEATKAALKGTGASGTTSPQVETATMSTIRTPSNS